jgi:cyclic pyranopterin phosphate synthase
VHGIFQGVDTDVTLASTEAAGPRSLLPQKEPTSSSSHAILDARKRPLRDLRISLTDRCNLRCTYCMPKEAFGQDHVFLPTDKMLTFDEIATLVRILAGLGMRKVKLTGGEPLTRPLLPRLIALLHQAAPQVEVNLITNGLLLAPIALQLKEAGLDRITVSLDTLVPDRFATISGRGRQLDKVLAGIEAARRAGFHPVKINMVVIRGVNDDEVEAVARAFRHPQTIVRFIEYMDVGTLNGWRREQVVPAGEILARLRGNADLVPVAPAYPGETAKRYRYMDGSGEIGFIASVTQPFCGDCNRLRLSADGKLYTCLFSKAGFDIKTVLRTSDGASVVRDALANLWKSRRDQYSIERAQASTREEQKELKRIEMFYIGG